MSDDIEVGDSVTWTSSGGSSKGRVKKKLTAPMEIKGHHVAASSDNPEFLVESESGGRAAHKPASLKKTSARKSSAKKTSAKSTAKKPTAKPTSVKPTSAKKSTAKKSTAKKAR
jgi:hypothetical protein